MPAPLRIHLTPEARPPPGSGSWRPTLLWCRRGIKVPGAGRQAVSPGRSHGGWTAPGRSPATCGPRPRHLSTASSRRRRDRGIEASLSRRHQPPGARPRWTRGHERLPGGAPGGGGRPGRPPRLPERPWSRRVLRDLPAGSTGKAAAPGGGAPRGPGRGTCPRGGPRRRSGSGLRPPCAARRKGGRLRKVQTRSLPDESGLGLSLPLRLRLGEPQGEAVRVRRRGPPRGHVRRRVPRGGAPPGAAALPVAGLGGLGVAPLQSLLEPGGGAGLRPRQEVPQVGATWPGLQPGGWRGRGVPWGRDSFAGPRPSIPRSRGRLEVAVERWRGRGPEVAGDLRGAVQPPWAARRTASGGGRRGPDAPAAPQERWSAARGAGRWPWLWRGSGGCEAGARGVA
jgi:hypothetical protein